MVALTMAFSDIETNPERWTRTGLTIEYPNPWRRFFLAWMEPTTIELDIYQKVDDDGELLRVAYYNDGKHKLGFSLP